MSEQLTESPTSEQVREAADTIRAVHAQKPRVAIVLGTGLGGLAEQIENPTAVNYADLPHFPRSTVLGHVGRLILGTLGGVVVAAMQGRFHLYEGYTPQQVVFPLRVLRLLGADTVIVTNAAGGLHPEHSVGDLMLLSDHIGLPSMAGLNPLRGENDEAVGPRFPPMVGAYSPRLRGLAQEAAARQGITLREGVYAMVSGPNYETPAELRFLRAAGADAVGMSTVPEVIAARHMNMDVLAVSCITNVALPPQDAAPAEATHAEVVAVANAAGERLVQLITEFVRALHASR
ncbi:MAG: purine-nucleoside phosphorylase [Ktedonobacterales bacterium]